MAAFRLVRLDALGAPVEAGLVLTAEVARNCAAAVSLYERLGYVEPWVSYIAVVDELVVGGCAFVGPPREGRVEIAYYTLAECQRRGHASRWAATLVDIAWRTDPNIMPMAFTLPEHNPSTRILQNLGFRQHGTAEDPDAGTVWEWRRTGSPSGS